MIDEEWHGKVGENMYISQRKVTYAGQKVQYWSNFSLSHSIPPFLFPSSLWFLQFSFLFIFFVHRCMSLIWVISFEYGSRDFSINRSIAKSWSWTSRLPTYTYNAERDYQSYIALRSIFYNYVRITLMTFSVLRTSACMPQNHEVSNDILL